MKTFIIKLLSLLIILTVSFTIFSCSDNNNDEPVPQKHTETLLLLFPYSGLENSISQNIDNFKQAIISRGGLGRKSMIVFQATSDGKARIYEIEYANGACTERIIEDNVSISFTSNDQIQITQDIQRILRIVKAEASAESYSLIIGSHGTAWLPAGVYSLSALNSRAFGTGTQDYQIDNSSLITALLNEGIHLNYILFDACFMANIETIYEYHEVCDYFISSPTEILAYGMPYEIMGNALLNNNYNEAAKQYYEFYSNRSAPYGTISVTDCRYMDDMASIMKQINQSASTTAEISGIQPMEGISSTVFYDFADYVNKICTDNALRSEFNNTMQLLVPYKYHTPTFYSVFGKKAIKVESFCGLNISEPTQHSSLTDAVRQTAWYAATH